MLVMQAHNADGRTPTMLRLLRRGKASKTTIGSRQTHSREILPHLQSISLVDLMAATGLSRRYCWVIKTGQEVPHQRHWTALHSVCTSGKSWWISASRHWLKASRALPQKSRRSADMWSARDIYPKRVAQAKRKAIVAITTNMLAAMILVFGISSGDMPPHMLAGAQILTQLLSHSLDLNKRRLKVLPIFPL